MTDWIEYGKTFGAFGDEGLCKPGVEIEARCEDSRERFNGKISRFLVGDINEAGGVCDDCMGLSSLDVVVRYRVVFQKEGS